MIEGESGILNVTPPDERPLWLAQKRELHWPNGTIGFLYTSEEPERLRGPEHDYAWCEEVGAWRNATPTWSNLRLGMRLAGTKGDRPQTIVTSTPRPTDLIRTLVANPLCETTRATTYENKENLAAEFVAAVLSEYEGTRLGKQELLGELLSDTPGAMWKLAMIERYRVVRAPENMLRVVVAIDPAVADIETRREAEREAESGSGASYLAETGIVVVGRARCLCRNREEQHGFVLDDLSGHYAPEEWASKAVAAYHERKADRVIAEVNNGGALVQATIFALGDRTISYKVHAAKGKDTRAEPIAALYERGMIHHVGVHSSLEDQMTTWNPLLSRRSPDRMDAAVWGLTETMLGPRPPSSAPSLGIPRRM
jgi:phage terminase large subunit-like protein